MVKGGRDVHLKGKGILPLPSKFQYTTDFSITYMQGLHDKKLTLIFMKEPWHTVADVKLGKILSVVFSSHFAPQALTALHITRHQLLDMTPLDSTLDSKHIKI